jgi:large subunit ribosomal protein L18e
VQDFELPAVALREEAGQKCQCRPVMSTSRLAKLLAGKGKDHIGVVAGTVTDDVRTHGGRPQDEQDLGRTICALRFTAGARQSIEKAKGNCITFDQLALQAPTGSKCVLLRGPLKARDAYRHFGTAPGCHKKGGKRAAPYVRSKGRSFEKARGRLASRGYKA